MTIYERVLFLAGEKIAHVNLCSMSRKVRENHLDYHTPMPSLLFYMEVMFINDILKDE